MPVSGTGAASGAAAGSTFGPWGTIIGGLIGAFAGQKKAAGQVPFTPTDLGASQQQAIAANKAAAPGIEQIVARSNLFQQGQANSIMEQAVPGYAAYAKKLLGFGSQALDNPYDLPPDVQKNLQRIAAEKGISVGTSGQTRQFSGLRDLGLNMLQYGNDNLSKAVSALTAVSGTAPRVSPMSPLSFFITPDQQFNANSANNNGRQATLQGANNSGAAADNYNRENMWQGLIQALGTGADLWGPKVKA